MVKFESFMAAYLLVIVSVSIFAAMALPRFQNKNNNMESNLANSHHFSVRWMGFAPTDYNSSYPEYYICVDNLKADQLTMQVALQVRNQEDRGYYFLIEQYVAPPAGWVVLPYQIGYIEVDETKNFVYSGASRTLPTSLPAGKMTESIELVVRAYYDEYVTVYSEDHFEVRFNFLDRTSPAWSVWYKDDFDDATVHNWDCTQEGGAGVWGGYGCSFGASVNPSSELYRSFQYSLKLTAWAQGYRMGWPPFVQDVWVNASYRKSFEIASGSEVYLIFALRSEQNWEAFSQYGVKINGKTFFKSDVTPQTGTWYQFTVPLQVGCTNVVDIWVSYTYKADAGTAYSYAYLDDVYVLAK